MKKILVSSLLLLTVRQSAQSFIEDKKGYSSIQVPVGNVSINTEGSLTFNYTYGYPSINDYIKKSTGPDQFSDNTLKTFDSAFVNIPGINRVLFGISASGESANGLQTLFENGNFVPGSKIQALIGFKCNFYDDNIYRMAREMAKRNQVIKPKVAELTSKQSELRSNLTSFTKLYKKKLIAAAKVQVKANKNPADTTYVNSLDSLFEELEANLEKEYMISEIIDEIGSLISKKPFDTTHFYVGKIALKDKFQTLQKETHRLITEINNVEDIIKGVGNKNAALRLLVVDHAKNNKPKLVTFYVSAERRNREFKLLNPTGTNPTEIYKEMTFDGFMARLGSNFYFNDLHIFGLSVGYQMTDNYDSLGDFKHETTTIVYQDSARKDVRNKTVAGKKGNYRAYQQFPIMLDYMFLLKSETDVLGISPYYRYYFIPKNDFKLKSNQTFGLGLYYFKKEKSPFTFGIYSEYNTTRAADDIRPWQQRLYLGIVAKLNLAPLNLEKY